jgi:hypothetical protein
MPSSFSPTPLPTLYLSNHLIIMLTFYTCDSHHPFTINTMPCHSSTLSNDYYCLITSFIRNSFDPLSIRYPSKFLPSQHSLVSHMYYHHLYRSIAISFICLFSPNNQTKFLSKKTNKHITTLVQK